MAWWKLKNHGSVGTGLGHEKGGWEVDILLIKGKRWVIAAKGWVDDGCWFYGWWGLMAKIGVVGNGVVVDGGNREEEEATIVSWPPWGWRVDGLMTINEKKRMEIPLLLVGVIVIVMNVKRYGFLVWKRRK